MMHKGSFEECRNVKQLQSDWKEDQEVSDHLQNNCLVAELNIQGETPADDNTQKQSALKNMDKKTNTRTVPRMRSIMEEIRSGPKLRKTNYSYEKPDLSKITTGERGAILNQIRAGVTLKKTIPNERKKYPIILEDYQIGEKPILRSIEEITCDETDTGHLDLNTKSIEKPNPIDIHLNDRKTDRNLEGMDEGSVTDSDEESEILDESIIRLSQLDDSPVTFKLPFEQNESEELKFLIHDAIDESSEKMKELDESWEKSGVDIDIHSESNSLNPSIAENIEKRPSRIPPIPPKRPPPQKQSNAKNISVISPTHTVQMGLNSESTKKLLAAPPPTPPPLPPSMDLLSKKKGITVDSDNIKTNEDAEKRIKLLTKNTSALIEVKKKLQNRLLETKEKIEEKKKNICKKLQQVIQDKDIFSSSPLPPDNPMMYLYCKAYAALPLAIASNSNEYVLQLVNLLNSNCNGNCDLQGKTQDTYCEEIEKLISHLSFNTPFDLPELVSKSKLSPYFNCNVHPFVGIERLYHYVEMLISTEKRDITLPRVYLDISPDNCTEFLQLCSQFLRHNFQLLSQERIRTRYCKPDALQRVIQGIHVLLINTKYSSIVWPLTVKHGVMYLLMVIYSSCASNFMFFGVQRKITHLFSTILELSIKRQTLFFEWFKPGITTRSMLLSLKNSLDFITKCSDAGMSGNGIASKKNNTDDEYHFSNTINILNIFYHLSRYYFLQPFLNSTLNMQEKEVIILPDMLVESFYSLRMIVCNEEKKKLTENQKNKIGIIMSLVLRLCSHLTCIDRYVKIFFKQQFINQIIHLLCSRDSFLVRYHEDESQKKRLQSENNPTMNEHDENKRDYTYEIAGDIIDLLKSVASNCEEELKEKMAFLMVNILLCKVLNNVKSNDLEEGDKDVGNTQLHQDVFHLIRLLEYIPVSCITSNHYIQAPQALPGKQENQTSQQQCSNIFNLSQQQAKKLNATDMIRKIALQCLEGNQDFYHFFHCNQAQGVIQFMENEQNHPFLHSVLAKVRKDVKQCKSELLNETYFQVCPNNGNSQDSKLLVPDNQTTL